MKTNLASTWLAHRESCGDTRADALRLLNSATRRRYTNSRLNEWLRGTRHPDYTARLAMLNQVLPSIMVGLGVSVKPSRYPEIAESLA